MKEIKACILDMDGLMIDSERVAEEAYIRAGSELNLEMTSEIYKRLIGTNLKTVHHILSQYFTDEEIVLLQQRMSEIKKEINETEGIKVKKGLYQLFDYLEQNKIKRIVATSTAKTVAKKMLQDINIYHRLDGGVYGDDVTVAKPKPDIFLKALEVSNVTAEQALILEDSHNGIRAANNANIAVIMIPDLLLPLDELKTLAVLNDLEEVIWFLESSDK